MAVFELFNC